MCFIPKLARELQSFETVIDMNRHMDLHYLSLKDVLTKSNDTVFHLIKKYSCKVVGVCWLKQTTLASLGGVSVKTVERTLKLLKDVGVLKIYRTKRSNGLNGNCYYVLQPYAGELFMDDEEIVDVEGQENVGAVEFLLSYETPGFKPSPFLGKLLINSVKALKNTLKPFEEDINNNARVKYKLNNFKTIINKPEVIKTAKKNLEVYECVIDHLVENNFTERAAKRIVQDMTHAVNVEPQKLLIGCAKTLNKLHKRLAYDKPITNVRAWFTSTLQEVLEPDYKRIVNKQETNRFNPSEKPFYNWLEA